MVEIIKKGSLPSEDTFVSICNHCKTIFRFKRGEARISFDQRDGDTLVIKCPVCERFVYNDGKTPERVYKAMQPKET